MKARNVVASITQQGLKILKKQKSKVSKKQKKAKVSKRKGNKDPKKEKWEKLVPDEQLEQCPLIPVTLEEFLLSKLQSLELQTYFDKRREKKFTVALCLTIIVLSDEDEDEDEVCSKVREGDCITSPICIPDSPKYMLASPEYMPASPVREGDCITSPISIPDSPEYTSASLEYTPASLVYTSEAFSPEYSPVPPMYYQNTPEYVRGTKQGDTGCRSDSEPVKKARKRLHFRDDEVNGKCMSDDEVSKHSNK